MSTDEAIARKLQAEEDARMTSSLSGSSKSLHSSLKPASERFKGNCAITSDMYFERNKMSADAEKEHKARLARLEGSSAITSDMYFDRSDDTLTMGANGRGRLHR